MLRPLVPRPGARLSLIVLAALLAIAALAGSPAPARAASYFNIVNTQTGRALEVTSSGQVRVAPLNRTSLAQQFKQIHRVSLGSFSEAAIQTRLGSCLRADDAPVGWIVAPVRVGSCFGTQDGGDSRRRWAHLPPAVTASPDVPGLQLVNSRTAGYVADFSLCFDACQPFVEASLLSASLVSADPGEFGGAVKWRYRFAVSATP